MNPVRRTTEDTRDWLVSNADGWRVVGPRTSHGGDRCGLTAHRGTCHPDEYVDRVVLRAMVEAELGFTSAEIASVYRQGPLSAEARELRDRIDARLLEIRESGGLMIELADALGWTIHGGGGSHGRTCSTMNKALARARKHRDAE